MENASAVLLSPFKNVIESLGAQLKPWTIIYELIKTCINLPNINTEMEEFLKEHQIYCEPVGFTGFKIYSQDLANEAKHLLLTHQESLRNPYLVGLWSIIEVAFEELMLRILINDPESSKKLHTAQINFKSKHEVGSREWAKDAYKQLNKQSSANTVGRVVEIHKNCLKPFGVILEYPHPRCEYIEELNQYRNCILHRQGLIDEKAIKVCPKLTPYLGMPINLSDEHFYYLLELLPNYVLAWMAALMYSPYLSSPMLPESKNPYSADTG